MNETIFITGTDTGVGKTLLTALLLHHLREEGCGALAMKPFCSGSREDAELLQALQREVLTVNETNPFYFPQPVAPWVANGKKIALKTVLAKISALKKRSQTLLIEGSGGIFVPLGDGYVVSDLIKRAGCPAIIVGRNRLGTINHTLMTIKVMQSIGIKQITIVLMDEEKPDFSAKTNQKSLKKLLPGTPIFGLPFLGRAASSAGGIKRAQKKVKKTLAQILGPANLTAFFPTKGEKSVRQKTC